MNHAVLRRWLRIGRRLLIVLCISLLSLGSVMAIAVAPSRAEVPLNSQEAHGQTKKQLTGRAKGEALSTEERIDRAYDINEAAGLREEKRQAEGKFDPREDNESLFEKVKDAVDSIGGQ